MKRIELMWMTLALACVSARSAFTDEIRPATIGERTAGDDWPQFLGPRRDGKSLETGIQTDIARWKIVWSRSVGEGYSIGSVAWGRYYHADRDGDACRLHCWNAETGTPLWSARYDSTYVDLYGYDGGPRCSPLIDGDRVYLLGVEGMLHCWSAVDGALRWAVDTQRAFGVVPNFFGVGSNPVIEGDLLLVMVGGSPPESRDAPEGRLDRVVPNGSAIVAFDKRTGARRWSIGDDLASYASLQVASIGDRRWGFAFARSGLLAFDPRSGAVDFRFPWRSRLLESVNASTPVVSGDEVFLSETYGPGSALLRVAPGKCDVVWRDDPRSRAKAFLAHWNTPILHNGFLYGCSGRHTHEAELKCIEWKTGKPRWSEPGLTRTSLLYVDGHFVCLGEDGVLRLVRAEPDRCSMIGERRLVEPGDDAGPFASRPLLRPPCWAAPILSHGLLVVRGRDRVVCLELIPDATRPR